MEVFVADREEAEVLALIDQLKQLGLRGRDAAYLASLAPPCDTDPLLRANFAREFRYMVRPERRAEAARLVGLDEW